MRFIRKRIWYGLKLETLLLQIWARSDEQCASFIELCSLQATTLCNEIHSCFCYSCIFFYRVFKYSYLFLWLGKGNHYLLCKWPLNTVYKGRRAGTYKVIFRYSSAKVVKTAEMYVFTRRKYTKILENFIRDFVLYVFGEDTAAYHCIWSAPICRSVVEKTATDALCIISAIRVWQK